MPTQHPFLPQHLALAIALALGCAEVSMAQSIVEKTRPFETTAEMQARLKVFAAAPDTNIQRVIKVQEASLSKDDSNDLVLVSRQGELIGLTDGGGGTNVLQLDIDKGGELGEIRNFQDLYLKRGEWSNDRAFDSSSLIDSNAKLINTGDIRGAMHVLGELVNRGTVAGPVFVGKKARFSGSGTVDALDVAGLMEVNPVTGAPSVINDFKLSKSATLVYGIDAEKGSATINVGGTATLGNATLKITAVSGESTEANKHVVIKADKINGTFGKVINELAFLKATPDYTVEKQVGLILERNGVPPEKIATSENGRNAVNGMTALQPAKPPRPDASTVSTNTQTTAGELQTEHAAPKLTGPSKLAASTQPKPAGQVQAIKPAHTPNTAINALLGTNLTTAADAIDQLGGYDTADLGNATLSSVAPISTGMLSAMDSTEPGVHGSTAKSGSRPSVTAAASVGNWEVMP